MLKTDYQDAQAPSSARSYIIRTGADNISTITDVTPYTQRGDAFGAGDINATNSAVNGGAYWPYTHLRSEGRHLLQGSGAHIEFVASADYAYGDEFVYNGTLLPARTQDGLALPDGYFKAGAVVQCVYDGQKLNFKQGGALRLTVLCAAEPSALPAAAAPYTFCVITPLSSPAQCFGSAQPQNARHGTLWFRVSAQSSLPVNMSPNGQAWLYPGVCMQYDAEQDAWLRRNYFVYTDGEWREFTHLYYCAGTFNEITGVKPWGTHQSLQNEDCLVLKSYAVTTTYNGGFYSIEKIDVTELSKITVELRVISTDCKGFVGLRSAAPTESANTCAASATVQKTKGPQSAAFDVSRLTGSYYLVFCITSWNGTYRYEIDSVRGE